MNRRFLIMVVAILVVNLAGCTALQKKFTPKKKQQVTMPRIYHTKEYEKKPTPELYQKHYAYWMTWQSELIKFLGENGKKDKRCIQEIVGNLRDMQNILVEEKAIEFEPHIARMEGLKDTIFGGDMTQANKDDVRRSLEREDRAIKREFCLRKMRNYLKKSFDEEPESGQDSVVFLKKEDAPGSD